MHERALFVVIGRSLLPVTLGLFLSPAGCSPEQDKSENRAPATKNLQHIEELLKKGAVKASPGKGG
jgi:hypothetical protein